MVPLARALAEAMNARPRASEGTDAGAVGGEPVAPASNQIEFNDVPARPSEIAYQR